MIAMYRCAANTIWKGGPISNRDRIIQKGANKAPFCMMCMDG